MGALKAQSNPKVLVVSQQGQVYPDGCLYVYADSTNIADVFEVIQLQQKGRFKAIPLHDYNFGNTSTIQWICMRVRNASLISEFVYSLPFPYFSQIELFEVRQGQVRSLGTAGELFPFQQRPYPSKTIAFPLSIQPHETIDYFLMIDKRGENLQVDISIWDYNTFGQHTRYEYMAWGIFAGVLLFLFLVNGFIYWVNRDDIFIWYNLFLLASIFYQWTDVGFSFQYLWRDWPSVNRFNPEYLATWLIMFSQSHFMQRFIGLSRSNSRVYDPLNKALKVLLGALVLFVILPLAMPTQLAAYRIVANLTFIFVIVFTTLAVWAVVEQLYRKDKSRMVVFYAYALLIQMVGNVIIIVLSANESSGTISVSLKPYTVAICTLMVDVVVFSYGLVYRYNLLHLRSRDLQWSILQSQQKRSQKVIDTLEEERRRIAQDLHDEVGATLATAKGYLSMAHKQHKQQAQDLLTAQQLLDKASEDLRTISHNLMPKQFERIGLASVLDESIRKMSKHSTVSFNYLIIGDEIRLPRSLSIQIFRIAIELIDNVLRHANATDATIQLVYHGSYLNLVVEDNGKGFDSDDEQNGLGLRNLRNRAAYIHADISMDSSESGTTVILEVPFPNQPHHL